MNKLYFIALIVLMLLTGCHQPIRTLNYGAKVPSNVNNVTQVHHAILDAIKVNQWTIIKEQPNYIQVSKQQDNQLVIIDIVYGYEGYDIEYVSSENMHYNLEKNSISRRYMRWETELVHTINHNLRG